MLPRALKQIPPSAHLLLLAGVLLAPKAQALEPDRALTQYVHRIWQAQQGLPAGAIFQVFQATNGYIWLGTQNGLFRFDGVRFTNVDRIIPDAPGAEWVRQAFESADGTLWIGTNENGVFALRREGSVHYTTDQGLPSNAIHCLIPSADGGVWVCTEEGVARIDPGAKERPVRPMTDELGYPRQRALAACEDANGNLWTGGDGVVIVTGRPGSFAAREIGNMPPSASVRSMLCDGETVWAGTTNGLVRLRGGIQGNVKLYRAEDGMVDGFVFALARGANDTLWIGTRNGFSRLRGETFDSFRPQYGLSQSTAQTVFEDREGSLWVGTKRGLNQFADGRSLPYTVTEGLPSNEAGPILEDSRGSIWMGTLDAGLARFDGKQFQALTARDGLSSDTVLALAEDADRSIWVGTSRGLNRVRDGAVEAAYVEAQGLPSIEIRSLYRDHAGVLWVGTAAGLASLREGVFVREPASPRVPIRAIAQDRERRLVIATEESVYRRQNGRFTELSQRGVYMRNATSLYLDNEGLLWVGLNGAGLRVIESSGGGESAGGGESSGGGDRITSISTRDGLYDGEIYGITADTFGRMWMTCSRGVFWVARDELLRYAAGRVAKVNSYAYSPTDSLRVIEARLGVQPSVLMRDGWLWFPTIKGVIAFDAISPAREMPAPIVVIEDPLVDGQSQRPEDISELPGGQKNLEFVFAGLSYTQPAGPNLHYKLEGYDTDWINAGQRREAVYTNLPPRQYTFRVAACGSAERCAESESQASVDFSLTPLFYQRSWFWPLIAALLALAAWAAYQLHIRRLRGRYDLILAERSRIARELHDTLIQGFSGITMALQAFTSRVKAPDDRAMLEDIIADAATCVRETRQSVAGLRAVTGSGSGSGLAAAISHAVKELTGSKGVRLKLNMDEQIKPLPAEVEYNLLRIASEAVANSLKHSGAHTIEVNLQNDAEGLHLQVKDDGMGFSREEGAALGSRGHYGLIGMKERATQIGAAIDLKSQPGGGTTVSVNLPNRRASEMAKMTEMVK